MQKKMEDLGESQLRNFTLDAPTGSVYQFEGEDFREKRKVTSTLSCRPSPQTISCLGSGCWNSLDWAAKTGKKGKLCHRCLFQGCLADIRASHPQGNSSTLEIHSFYCLTLQAPRPPKQPNVQDYQFFPPRLFELLDQEIYHYRKTLGYKVKITC